MAQQEVADLLGGEQVIGALFGTGGIFHFHDAGVDGTRDVAFTVGGVDVGGTGIGNADDNDVFVSGDVTVQCAVEPFGGDINGPLGDFCGFLRGEGVDAAHREETDDQSEGQQQGQGFSHVFSSCIRIFISHHNLRCQCRWWDLRPESR